MTATTELLEVRLRTDRGTVLIEPLGELDIATVPLLADAFDSLADDPQSTQRIVLDLRGLTFMDATGINVLLHRNSEAQQNRHSLAVIRGGASINRLITLTAIDQRLAFVDGPEDLRPPLPPTLARPA